MEFIKNELINAVLEKYFETFSKTLDTADYVPAKYGKKIHAYIFKNMKRKFAEVNHEYKRMKKEQEKGSEADTACAASLPTSELQG
jgi:hypothetical protein